MEMIDEKTWIFPKNIEFHVVPQYLKTIEKSTTQDMLVFDLNNTENIHSSFIGFLIYVKKKLEIHGGQLVLKVSPSLQKTFDMLHINSYFSSHMSDYQEIPGTRTVH